MQSKKLFRTVALQSLAIASLALLIGSVAEDETVASASVSPWTALLATRDQPVSTVESHAAPRGVAVGSSRRMKRRDVVRVQPQTLLPIVNQEGILPNHKQILDEILRLLPMSCVNRLEHLYVRYDYPEQRGLAGASTVILAGNVGGSEYRALSNEEFRQLAGHEILGHFYELGCLEGTTRAANSAFFDGDTPIKVDDPSAAFYAISWVNASTPKRTAVEADFVSGYAHVSDPFEDLAETAVAYIFHRQALETLAMQNPIIAMKFAWMEKHMPEAVRSVATGRYTWATANRPWDMTKLVYDWHGTTAAVVMNGAR